MVKLNPTEIQLLTEALFEAESPVAFEDVKNDIDEEKDEFEMEARNELEETPESHVQFPIKRRRSVVYRRLFCVGLCLVLLCGGLILATYLLKSNNYVIEIKLAKGHTLTYHLEQEMIFHGSTIEKTTFSEVVTVQVVNKTSNGHWLRFRMASMPGFKGNFTFLLRVDLDGEKARMNLDSGKERFEIHTDSERNSEFDFYIHNLFNQLLPAVKIDLLDILLSQVTTRNRDIPVNNAWYLPGRVTMQQSINTDKEQVLLLSKINPENFLDFADPGNNLPNVKMSFEETASISKDTGMLLNSDLSISASVPLEGEFDTGATVGVNFTSSIRLAGEDSHPSDATTNGANATNFIRISKPSSPLANNPTMQFIPSANKDTNAKMKTGLVMEVKEMLNLTMTSGTQTKEQSRLPEGILTPFYTVMEPKDAINLAVAEATNAIIGQSIEEGSRKSKLGQLRDGHLDKNEKGKGHGKEEETAQEHKPSVEIGDWRVDRDDSPGIQDEAEEYSERNPDDEDYNEQERNEEDDDERNEENGENNEKRNDGDSNQEKSSRGRTGNKGFIDIDESSPTTQVPTTQVHTTQAPTTQAPTTEVHTTKATTTTATPGTTSDDWNPFSFIENFWHGLTSGPNEQELLSTTQRPTTMPTTKASSHEENKQKSKTTSEEEDGWNPFGFIKNFWHGLTSGPGEKESPSTTQRPTTMPTTKAPTHEVKQHQKSKTTSEEEDALNPFGFFENLWHGFDNDDKKEESKPKEDTDDSLFSFPSIPFFHFPDFSQRKRRSLEPDNDAPTATKVRPGDRDRPIPFFHFMDFSQRKRRSLEPENDAPTATKERPVDRVLRRDRRRLTDDGQDREDTTTTAGWHLGDLDQIWDVVSDKSFAINKRPRRTTRVFKETVLGVEVVSDLEHEVEALWDVVEMEERNYWSIRLKLGIHAGGHRFEVFNKVIDREEINNRFLHVEKPKVDYRTVHGGTLVMCRPLFYVQRFCVEMRFDFTLHLSHIITKLTKEYPVQLSVHFKHLAAVNSVVSSHATTLLNSGGVYGKGALFQAKIPLELQFTEARRPEWCTKASLRSRIGSFYRRWSGMNQWQCPLDRAVAMETTCTGLDKHEQHHEGKPRLTTDNAFTKKVHVLDSC